MREPSPKNTEIPAKPVWRASGLVLGLLSVFALIYFFDRPSTGTAPNPAAVTYQGHGLDYWANQLTGDDRIGRRAAQDALAEGAHDALPLLVELLRRPDDDLRDSAGDIIVRHGSLAIPHLAILARDRHPAVRYHAMGLLGDLSPDSASALDSLIAGLRDEEQFVAKEAAWAVAALGARSAPAVDALTETLAHPDPVVRLHAAGALASLGAAAQSACSALTAALKDHDHRVRRCAAEALAAMGPGAAAAVSALVEAFDDENVYVRICAVGAVGSIGAAAVDAVPALQSRREDPAMAAEIVWALRRLTGVVPTPIPVAPRRPDETVFPDKLATIGDRPSDRWTMLGGTPARNAVSDAAGVPATWNVDTGANIRWSVRLGDETYGSPVSDGKNVYVGTDNGVPRNRQITDERGVLMAFSAVAGKFLWQDTAPRLGRGLVLLPSTTSSPLVEGERLYYMTAQCQLRCLDTEGFRDGENDGPRRDEDETTPRAADLIWELDLGAALGVFPHEAANCSVVAAGSLLLVCTSNGVDEAHTNVPAPRAPSFIGVDKLTGKVAWRVVGPSAKVLHGQWSSPSVGVVNGRTLAFFGGGDGWLYALEAVTGREIWRFDGNPKTAVWRSSVDVRGITTRNSIIACPVFHRGRIYLAMGQDPEHGPGRGRLHAIDASGSGDVTESRGVWEYTGIGRTIASPVILGDLLFAADVRGVVHCVDVATGTRVWAHDLLAPVWGSLLAASGRIYVGDEDGQVTIFAVSRVKRIIGTVAMDAPIWSAPAACGGVLYMATAKRLFAIGN